MAKSTLSAKRRKDSTSKPEKPYADYPLFAHATKRWAKKIRGKFHYFGPWNDPDGALNKYLEQRDDLHAGRTPRNTGDGLTVRDLVNRFLSAKKQLLDNSELTARTFADYYATCERLISVFGKSRLVDDLASDDFEQLRASIADTRGAVSLGNEVQRTRVVFKYAYDAGLIVAPVRYGPQFKKPSKKVLRKERAGKGSRMLEPAELRKLLDSAPAQMKAMMLLALNCGFGNNDCGTLPLEAVDLAACVIDYARPKTGIARRCPLWAKTVKALRESITELPTPKD